MNMVFREFLILYQFFFSPQVKRSVIISNEDGISELSHELLNDLRLRALGNLHRSGKPQNIMEL